MQAVLRCCLGPVGICCITHLLVGLLLYITKVKDFLCFFVQCRIFVLAVKYFLKFSEGVGSQPAF